MAPEEQLERERRGATVAGYAALGAGICVLLATFSPAFVGGGRDSARSFDGLISLDERPIEALLPAFLQALAFPLAAIALVYLYRASRARRPETLKAAYYLALIGPAPRNRTVTTPATIPRMPMKRDISPARIAFSATSTSANP